MSTQGNTLTPNGPADSLAAASVLCTELDGTLLRADPLWESLLLLIKSQPTALFLIPIWLLRGKAYFKSELARRVSLNPAILPYREDVLDFLRQQKMSGKEIILTTSSNRKVAESISNHLGLFSGVLASDEKVNLVGHAKLAALREILADREFDYLGKGSPDLAVWQAAKKSFVVTYSGRLVARVAEVSTVGGVFSSKRDHIRHLLAAFRVHHWTKNLLLFIPLLLAHKIFDAHRLLHTVLAFFSFCGLASTGYVINDVFDLEADRVHSIKRFRPLACGALPIWFAVTIVPLLALGTLSAVWLLSEAEFAALVTAYFACSIMYSRYLKRIPVLDILILAGLYTLRLLAGGVVSHVSVSPWLLGFSMFFFLSLAYVKRFSEILTKGSEDVPFQNRRGYVAADRDLLRTLGPVSGYISVLVFALYVSGREVEGLYRRPQYLWFIAPLLLYWITRIWLMAERGEVDEDPVVFAIRDRASYLVGMLVVLILLVSL